MANPVPVAGGFAAALETYLSRGGSRVSKPRGKPGMRYSEGPLRGKTVEQATQQAREMWAKAPESVREKYAKQERELMTRSELEAEKNRMAAGIGPGWSRESYKFSDGTRRAAPGDLNGDRVQDVTQPAVQAAAGAAKPLNPAATTGAGRGTAIKNAAGAAKPLNPAATTGAGRGTAIKNAAVAGAPGATGTPGTPGPTGGPDWENMGVASRAPQVHPTGEPGPWKEPTTAAAKPKIAAALEGVQVGTGANAGKMNPLTGKPIGYVPPAQQIPSIERPTLAGVTFDPKYGAVPKAREVAEAPMGPDEYNRVKASQDVNDVNALDPRSPEASAARGRMRTYEGQVAAQAASAARRERLGPSAAEVDAQQRQARRGLDRKVAASYGNTRQF